MIEPARILGLLSSARQRTTFGETEFLLREVLEWTDFDGVILWFPWEDEGSQPRVYAAGSYFRRQGKSPVFHSLSADSKVGRGIKLQKKWTSTISPEDPAGDWIEKNIIEEFGMRAVVGIPFGLTVGPTRSWTTLVSGSLNFYRCEQERREGKSQVTISEEDLELLEQCTQVFAHCFTSMVDAVGFQLIEQLREKIKILSAVGGLFDHEMESATRTFESLIQEKISCREVCLHFIREDLGGNRVYAPAGIWPWPEDRAQLREYERGDGITGRCFMEGKTFISGDALQLAEQGKAMPGFTRDQAERGGVPKGLGGELAPIAVIAIPLVEAQATVGVLRCAAKSCSPYFFAVHEVFFLEQASALIADWFGRRISTYRARRTNQGIKALVNHVAQLGAELSKLSAGTGEPRFFVGYLENLMRAWKETLPPDSRLCYRELREGGSFQRVQSLPVDRGRKSESVRRGFSWKAYEKAVQSYFDAPGGQWPESPWASESNADFLVFPLSGGHDGIQQVIEVVGPANSSLSELDRQIGYLSSMIAAFANVLSHYVQGEQQAKREQKEAKETEEKTFKLLAHQVRTPLSTSLWALETLVRRAEARPVNPEKLRDTAQDIRQSILRAYRVAQRMRVYSEIAAQDRLSKVEVRDVPVYELAKRVREMAADHQRQSAAKKGMTIQVYARNESGSAPVRADLDLLEQAVEIVLENAVKYGDWHSEIAIELASGDHGRAQLIKVRNSARTTPLRSDEVKRIMEFGVRMDKANKKSGWGAGLYLAQVIVKGHGGELSVSATSEKDKTTIFTLSIPTGLR